MAKQTITIIGIVKNDCITGIQYGEIQIEVTATPRQPISTFHNNKHRTQPTPQSPHHTVSYNKMQYKGQPKQINISKIIVCSENPTTRQARRAYRQAKALYAKKATKRTKQK